MKKPEILIGKKVYGFKFEDKPNIKFDSRMLDYVGKIGLIDEYRPVSKTFKVEFEDGEYWGYPYDQIEAHLVEDETPTLTDGVMMLVSNNNLEYDKEEVFFKYNNKHYVRIGMSFEPYDYAKPLEPTKEEQLIAILGSSEKVSEIMELFKKD